MIWTRLKTACTYALARRLPTCEEILPLISQKMDERLPWRKRLAVFLHNYICEWCKRYDNQLLFLRQAVRTETPESTESLSSEARERMKNILR